MSDGEIGYLRKKVETLEEMMRAARRDADYLREELGQSMAYRREAERQIRELRGEDGEPQPRTMGDVEVQARDEVHRHLLRIEDQFTKRQYLNALASSSDLTGALLRAFSAVLKER